MNIAQVSVTAVTTLIAVGLGGWLTTRAQDRLWRRDQQRQWRDIRLAAYTGFLAAFREYISYALRPDARITAVPRPRPPHDLMPYFDEKGSAYRERLEATKTELRLVSAAPRVVEASSAMVRQARLLAAERATHEVGAVPDEHFDALWTAEREFVQAARAELGLPEAFRDSSAG
ncbi:hypothetical protein [Paractinoplanes rishiriensis]|uniref:Uncharacterized protein n=1 Tax=Paractinoplanes rishiriensis TaxID=1050105 RepID=A0A919N0M1_9ACTN|nr:hypothetical protein [Actinoplanes rishiriensis]GIE99800.1 hypothetical protein Ari01nite_72650 [Actinoplanes rishiriensis]